MNGQMYGTIEGTKRDGEVVTTLAPSLTTKKELASWTLSPILPQPQPRNAASAAAYSLQRVNTFTLRPTASMVSYRPVRCARTHIINSGVMPTLNSGARTIAQTTSRTRRRAGKAAESGIGGIDSTNWMPQNGTAKNIWIRCEIATEDGARQSAERSVFLSIATNGERCCVDRKNTTQQTTSNANSATRKGAVGGVVRPLGTTIMLTTLSRCQKAETTQHGTSASLVRSVITASTTSCRLSGATDYCSSGEVV